MAVHVGQAAVDAVVSPGERGVLDAEEFEHSGMHIVDGRGVVAVEGLVAPLVALAVGDASFDAGAAEPVGKHEGVVVAAAATLGAVKLVGDAAGEALKGEK